MGCTQSLPAGGGGGATSSGPGASDVDHSPSSPISISFNAKGGEPTVKQSIRDSVQDITGHDGRSAGKGGHKDSGKDFEDGSENPSKGGLLGSTLSPSTSNASHSQSKAPSQGQLATTPSYGGGGGRNSGGYASGSNVVSPRAQGGGGGGGGGQKSSLDNHSNRSSFANEGIAPASKPRTSAGSARGRGGGGGSFEGAGGGGGGRRSGGPLPALEPARSSQQARLSSIQAADVMGVGADKNVVSTRVVSPTYDPLPGFQPSAALAAYYPLLGALPPDTPVPLEVLARLWRAANPEEATEIARSLAAAGIVRLAALDDGSRWALPSPQHVAHAAVVWPGAVAAVHGQVLDGYTRGGALGLDALRDDGYIIQALSHHLVGSGRVEQLRRLLMNPSWLEAKLHAYGVGAVVRDFRRYLQEAEGDDASVDVKLLLQAFQLSLGAAMEHPAARMMREQMLARLMAVAAGGRLKEWFAEQTAKCAAEGMLAVNSRLLHLMPRSPSLAQAGGVQRMTLRGHTAPIRRVAIAPNCCDVVTISEDGSAQVWDMNIGDCVMQLARDSPLTAVGMTPDSAAAVVAAADGTAAVWNLAAGQVTHTLAGHTARITSLAIDKQGIRVVTGSEDRTARVWNLQDGSCEAILQGHGGSEGLVGAVLDVCVCADGTLAATTSDDFSARVWDLDEDGEQLHVLEGHGGWVTSAAFVGTTHRLVTASHDSTAKIWDALRGRLLFTLTGHSGRLNRVSVDVGGSWAITTSDDNTARVWDCETGELKLVLEGHSAHLTDAAITRDGRKAVTVSGDGTGAVWDMATGQREMVLEGHTGEVACVVLTQRGRFAVTAGEDATARVWDLATEPLVAPPCHLGGVRCLQPLPDGGLVVSAGEDGRVFLWDPVDGVCLKRMDGHQVGVRFMRVSADGAQVLTGSGDRQICRWNWAEYSAVVSGTCHRRSMERRDLMMHTMTTANGSGGSANASHPGGGGGSGGGTGGSGAAAAGRLLDGAMAAAGGGGGGSGGERKSEDDDPTAALDRLRVGGSAAAAAAADGAAPKVPSTPGSPRAAHLLAPAGSASAAACLSPLGPSPLGLSPLGLSPLGGGATSAAAAAGPASAAATDRTSNVSLLDLCATVQADPLRSSMPAQQGSRVKHMAFDGACRTAAVLLFDSTVSVWDVGSGKCTAQLIKRGERDRSRTHSGGVNAVYLTRDAATAVTISKDYTARVWDVATESTRFVVEGHTDGLVAADISHDEALLATAAFDKTVRVTRMATGAAIAVLDHPQPPVSVAFSPNCRHMAVGLEDHTVVVWDLVGRACLPSLDAHKLPLSVLTWSPDSRFLLTAGADCTARLWRAEDGRQQAFFMGDTAIATACFAGNPVSDIVVLGDAAGALHFLDFAEELQG